MHLPPGLTHPPIFLTRSVCRRVQNSSETDQTQIVTVYPFRCEVSASMSQLFSMSVWSWKKHCTSQNCICSRDAFDNPPHHERWASLSKDCHIRCGQMFALLSWFWWWWWWWSSWSSSSRATLSKTYYIRWRCGQVLASPQPLWRLRSYHHECRICRHDEDGDDDADDDGDDLVYFLGSQKTTKNRTQSGNQKGTQKWNLKREPQNPLKNLNVTWKRNHKRTPKKRTPKHNPTRELRGVP